MKTNIRKIIYGVLDLDGHFNIYCGRNFITSDENDYANDRSSYASYNGVRGIFVTNKKVTGFIKPVLVESNQNYTAEILVVSEDVIIDHTLNSIKRLSIESLRDEELYHIDRTIDSELLLQRIEERNSWHKFDLIKSLNWLSVLSE